MSINIPNEVVAPTVSIITPTFNRAKLLPRVWQSLCKETIPFEWIVVDDASTDDTSSVIEGFNDPRTVYLKLVRNSGSNIARNEGVRNSHGKFILFLDSDDELAVEALRQAVRILESADPGIGALLMIAQATYSDGKRLILQDGEILGEEDLLIRNRLYGDHAVIYKREVFTRQMLPDKYRESQFVFVFGISRWWKYLVVNQPLTLVHRQDDNLSQARGILSRSQAIALGWEDVIRNHVDLLQRHPSAERRLYMRVLYRYATANDQQNLSRAFREFRKKHTGLRAWLEAKAMVLAGAIGRSGGDRLRIAYIRRRDEGVRRKKR